MPISSSASSSRASPWQSSEFTFTLPLQASNPFESVERDLDDLSIGSDSDSGQELRTGTNSPFSSPPPQVRCNMDSGDSVPETGARGTSSGRTTGALDLGEIDAALDTLDEEHASRQGSPVSGPNPTAAPPAPQPKAGASRPNRRRSAPADQTPHSLDDERVPGDRFNDPAFQQAYKDAKEVAIRLSQVLGSGDLHQDPSSVMSRLHRTARKLARFHPPSTRSVGFVGDSGVGKSSLLNSLLDIQGLAKTSNEGAACTCVATEYRYHNDANFVIEIDPFSEAQVNTQLLDLLKAYRHYHLRGDELLTSELRDFENRAILALDTFTAMFGSRLGQIVRSTGSAPGSIACLLESDEGSVLRMVKGWAREAMASAGPSRLVLADVAECSTRLTQLTSDVAGAQGQLPWPFISRIKVSVNANILQNGLILVDLPGLRDLNTARRNITERYLLNVHEIFAVCNIGRAITDEGVKAVFDLAERAKLSNVSIICTRSDDIRPEEAVTSWSGSTRRSVQTAMDTVEEAREAITEVERELETYEDDDPDDLDPEEHKHFSNLSRQARAARLKLRTAEFELKKLVVETRNAMVKEHLIQTYEARIPPNTALPIFCISNSEYWLRRQDRRELAMPHLLLSGVLAIREHCRAKVSESQHRVCLEYMREKIPALLGEIGLWVSSSEAGSMEAERRRALRSGLTELESRLRRDIDHNPDLSTLGSHLVRDVRETLINPARLRVAGWTRAADNASREWAGWQHASYSAFCRKYGDYVTKAIGRRCWNDEAIEDMVDDAKPLWENTQARIYQHYLGLIESLSVALDDASEYLHDNLGDNAALVAQLDATLRSHQHLLVAELHDLGDAFHDDVRKLQIDAVSGIRTSFVGKYMEEPYRNAIFESGSGSDDRRKRYIGNAFRNQDLFLKPLNSVREQFSDLAEGLHQDVTASVQDHLGRVRDVLDILRSDNAAREGDENPRFRNDVRDCASAAGAEMTRVLGIIREGSAA